MLEIAPKKKPTDKVPPTTEAIKTVSDEKDGEEVNRVYESFDTESAYDIYNKPSSIFAHMKRKAWEHKIITIGALSTCGAMFLMFKNRNDPYTLNKYARWRITLQGFTFGALLYAMYHDERKFHDSPYPWDWDWRKKFRK